MKKFILTALVAVFSFSAASADKIQVKQDSKGNYVQVGGGREAAKNTGKTFTDRAGKVYPVFQSAKGKLFVNRVSKAGKSYKMYLN